MPWPIGFLLAVLATGWVSAAQGLSSGGPIGPPTGISSGPEVVVAPTRTHVVFAYQPQSGAQAQLFVTSSSDSGQSFSNSRQIAATRTSSTAPAAAAGPKTGTLYIAWTEIDADQHSAAVYFSRSTDLDQANSFTTPLRVSSSGIALAPRLVTDADENIHLIWESGENSITRRQVFFARSVDQGASFSPETALSTVGAFARPNLVSVGGGLFAIWKDESQQPGGVVWAQSSDRGEHFSTPVAATGVSAISPRENGLSAAALSATSFGFLFQDTSTVPDAVWLVRADAKGPSFQAAIRLEGAEGVVSAPLLVSLPLPSGSSNIATAWLGRLKTATSTSFGLALSCADENGEFHDPRLLAPLGSGGGNLTVASDAAGLVHAVVVQTVGQDSNLLYTQGRCPPRFRAAWLVSAASQQVPGVIPGSLATLYGAELGPTAGAQVAALDPDTGMLVRSAGGVRVELDGVLAPLFYIRRDQINFQVPVEVAGKSAVQLTVEYQGVRSLAVETPVVKDGASFFTWDASGLGPVAAANEDGSLNGRDGPAARNSIVVLFMTGHGLTSPALKTGELAPVVEPFARPLDALSVIVDGKPAEVLFAGGAPGFAGLLQVNTRVPSESSSGLVRIQASMGSFTSREGTTLSVK